MSDNDSSTPYAIVLGTAQDGGYPQAGCRRSCCLAARSNPKLRRLVSSLAVVDPESSQRWIVDCTPDFSEQLYRLDQLFPTDDFSRSTGILLTHAHIGHYTGLIHLGREVTAANGVRLFVMPRMLKFLENNEPWKQLIQAGHVIPVPLTAGQSIQLSDQLSVRPILVPHRDEHSETVCFRIEGPHRSLLYLPDIDDWGPLDPPIEKLVAEVDVALLDGTFFDEEDIIGRDTSEIPHPRIGDSLERFSALPPAERAKIRFTHLNHTNSAIVPGSDADLRVQSVGCDVASDGERHGL